MNTAFPVRPVSVLILILALALLPALGGCASFFTGAPPARVQLNPAVPDPVPGTAKTRKIPILIAAPQAERDIDSERVALLFNNREIRALAGYRWSSTAPVLVQQALVRSLERSGAFASVSDDGAGVAARYVVIGNLYAFQFRYDGESGDTRSVTPPTATMDGLFRLLDLQTGAILSSVTVSEERPVAGTDVPAMMEAQEAVLSKAVADVGAWLVRALADPRVRP